MSTFMAKPADVQRKWYIVDAAGKPLGRTAVKVADLLRGKGKPEFTPNVDCGDFVIVINADKAVLTGKKLQQKFYRRHTGWIGHLKEVKYDTLMNTRPELAMELAIKGMVPDTTIGRKALTRLHVYQGTEYKQVAQKPELVD
jgi:large subunit ribosomal protein L13